MDGNGICVNLFRRQVTISKSLIGLVYTVNATCRKTNNVTENYNLRTDYTLSHFKFGLNSVRVELSSD